MDSKHIELAPSPTAWDEESPLGVGAPLASTCDEGAASEPDDSGFPADQEALAAKEVEPGDSSLRALESELGEENSSEDELAAPGQTPMVGFDCVLPEALVALTDKRIRIWSELLSLDEKRRKLCGKVYVREIRDEASRQDRELQRAPGAEALVQSMAEVNKKISNPVLPSLAAPLKPGETKPEPKPGEIKPEKLYCKLLEWGLTQCKLLRLRAHLDGQITEAALPAVEGEPLLTMCKRLGIEIEPLMAWTYYGLGLFQRLADCRERENEHAAKVAAAARAAEHAGVMSRLKNACLGTQQELTQLDPAVRRTRSAIEKELHVIDPVLSEMFWKLYADVAWALASGGLQEDEKPVARAMLRYGMVSGHPGLLAPEMRDFILEDCARDVYTFSQRPDALHVAYADEYITAIHDRVLTVSPDEDLELNNRRSEQWKADRVWRQVATYSIRKRLYEGRLEELQKRVADLNAICEKQKAEHAQLRTRTDPRAGELAQKLMLNRVELAHTRRAVERFEGKLIPDLQARVDEANEKFDEAAEVFTPEMVVRREALFVRRLARLACRLKEPYLPFVLRETFVAKASDHFSRASVLEALTRWEKADCRIFHEVLINHKKPERRITVRMSPTFLIIPGRGQLGLSLSPRKWDDLGRMILPLQFQRQNGLDNLLIDILSDFRWDCSKEDAGAEWITADALCAAYAAVRWNYRRLSEEAQGTMGLDRKKKDRENWRVHYRLYMTSAQDAGRYLFNKCHDVYKSVVVRHIGMPPGVEALRRD